MNIGGRKMVTQVRRPEREQADIEATRIGAGASAQDLVGNEIDAAQLAFRPLPGASRFRDQAASREPSAAWRVAASPASAPQSADEDGIAPVHRRRSEVILFSVVFAVGIISGVGVTSMLAPSLSESVRSLASGDFSEQLGALQQFLAAPRTALPVPPATVAGGDDAPVLSAQDAKTEGPGPREARSLSHPVQMPTASDTAAASVIEEAAGLDHAKVNPGRSLPGAGVVPSEQQRLPAPESQPTSNEVQLRQVFEQFLNERQQPLIGQRDREGLFVDFKNSLAKGLPRTAPISAGTEGTRQVEIWQALDTTNLRELGSSDSAVVGTVAKGSTFRVVGRSKDGQWLKIETRDGSTGYFWAARAREMR